MVADTAKRRSLPLDPVDSAKLNRRTMLLGAVLLVGGAAALTRFARNSTANGDAAGPALTAEQFALLEQVCEMIIPTTDTPGAIVAGVPGFIREMLEQWSSPKSRAEIVGVLADIDRLAWSR